MNEETNERTNETSAQHKPNESQVETKDLMPSQAFVLGEVDNGSEKDYSSLANRNHVVAASATHEGQLAVPLFEAPGSLVLISTFRKLGPTNKTPHVSVRAMFVAHDLKPISGTEFPVRRYVIKASGAVVELLAHHDASAQYLREILLPRKELTDMLAGAQFFSIAQRGETVYHYQVSGANALIPENHTADLKLLDKAERESPTGKRMQRHQERKKDPLSPPKEYVDTELAKLYYERREQLDFHGYGLITWQQFHEDYQRVKSGKSTHYPTPDDEVSTYNPPDYRAMCSGLIWDEIRAWNLKFGIVTPAPERVEQVTAPTNVVKVVIPESVPATEPVGWGNWAADNGDENV